MGRGGDGYTSGVHNFPITQRPEVNYSAYTPVTTPKGNSDVVFKDIWQVL